MTRRPSVNSNQQQARPKSEVNNTTGVIRADEIYVAEEYYRRMRWRKHSIRQAKRLGLPTIRYGSRDYIIGADAIEWFRRLGSQQREAEQANGNGTSATDAGGEQDEQAGGATNIRPP